MNNIVFIIALQLKNQSVKTDTILQLIRVAVTFFLVHLISLQ